MKAIDQYFRGKQRRTPESHTQRHHAPPEHGFGFAEDGHPIPTTDFDWSAIEHGERLETLRTRAGRTLPAGLDLQPETLKGMTQTDVDRALHVLRVLLQWIWQNGTRNPDGLQLRSMITCWIFLKELRPLPLADLARSFGKKKQSVGRWVEDFKRRFPRIRLPHMQAQDWRKARMRLDVLRHSQEALARADRLGAAVDRLPLAHWTEPARAALRQQLRPLVQALWPYLELP